MTWCNPAVLNDHTQGLICKVNIIHVPSNSEYVPYLHCKKSIIINSWSNRRLHKFKEKLNNGGKCSKCYCVKIPTNFLICKNSVKQQSLGGDEKKSSLGSSTQILFDNICASQLS